MLYGKDNTNLFYMAYALALAILIASIAMLPHWTAIASAIILAVAVVILHSGTALRGLLIRNSVVEVTAGSYRISQNLASISRPEGDKFRAVSIAMLIPRHGSMINGRPLRELMDSISERFEFSIELAEADKTKILEYLRTKMHMKEIALSRLKDHASDKSAALRRQIDLINGDISSLASSGSSFRFAILVKSIAVSQSRAEAESLSARRIETLAGKFSAALGVDHEILRSDRLLAYGGALN